MIRAEDGVAGFFEDLPVLMFVLLGVSVLVTSGAWVAEENTLREQEEELDDAADAIVRRVLGSFTLRWGDIPRVASLIGSDLATLVSQESRGLDYAFTVASLHPEPELLLAASKGETSSGQRTGFASALFNAVDERGVVLILEANAIVW